MAVGVGMGVGIGVGVGWGVGVGDGRGGAAGSAALVASTRASIVASKEASASLVARMPASAVALTFGVGAAVCSGVGVGEGAGSPSVQAIDATMIITIRQMLAHHMANPLESLVVFSVNATITGHIDPKKGLLLPGHDQYLHADLVGQVGYGAEDRLA